MKNKQTFAAKAKAIIGESGWAKLAKAVFEDAAPAAADTPAMTEAILADGTKIIYDVLEEGGKVMVITESGEMPAPDGDLTMEDGTVVSITGGLITAITKATEDAPTEGAPASVDMTAIEKMMDEKVSALYEKMTTKMAEEDPEAEKEKEEIKEEMRAIKEAFGATVEIIAHLMTEQKAAPKGEVAAQAFNAKEQRRSKFTQAQSLIKEMKEKIKEEQKSK